MTPRTSAALTGMFLGGASDPNVIFEKKGDMRALLVVFAMLAVMGCASQNTAQSPDIQTRRVEIPPLKVELLPPSEPIAAGIRTLFKFRISNVSSSPVDLPWPGFIDQFIHTEVTGPKGFKGHLKGKRLSLGHGKYPGGDIAPGKSIETELSGILPEAGEYVINSYLQTSRSETSWWTFWEGRVDATDIAINVLKTK